MKHLRYLILCTTFLCWGISASDVSAQEVAQEGGDVFGAGPSAPEEQFIPPPSKVDREFTAAAASYNQVQQAMAGLFGIPPDSPELEAFGRQGGQSFRRVNTDLPSRVLGHYVLTNGIPMPSPESMTPPKLSPEQNELLEKARGDAEQRIAEFQRMAKERWGQARALESCSASSTRKYELAKGDSKNEVVLIDLLLIAKPLPLNPEELFGKSVTVIQYRSGGEDPISAAVSGAGVPCLPYRVRVVGSTRFEHQGVDALKNFDSSPLGKGRVDAKLRDVLRGYE